VRDRERTQRRWQQLIAAQRASGLPVTEFCRRERIQKSGFYYWRRRVPGTPSEAFVELRVKPASRGAANPNPPAIEVRLERGRSLVVPAGFDEAHLVKLIIAMENLA
jgi:hypothetical protein